jgi:hypothetical protein
VPLPREGGWEDDPPVRRRVGEMRAAEVVQNNPNATIATLAGALTVIVVWIIGVAGFAVPAEVGSAFTTLIAGMLLALGRPSRRPAPAT